MNAERIERSKRFESCESQKVIWGPFSFLLVKMMWQRAAAVDVLSLSQGAFHHHERVSRHEHGGGAGIQVGAAFLAHDGHGKQAASGLCLDLRNAAWSATGDGHSGWAEPLHERKACQKLQRERCGEAKLSSRSARGTRRTQSPPRDRISPPLRSRESLPLISAERDGYFADAWFTTQLVEMAGCREAFGSLSHLP